MSILSLTQDGVKKDFAGLDTTNPNAVVVGLPSNYFTYEHLNQVLRLLIDNKHCKLIVVYNSCYRKCTDDLSLGLGLLWQHWNMQVIKKPK